MGEDSDAVVTYWRDQDHCNVYAAALKQKLALPDSLVNGAAVNVRRPRGSWWKRYSMNAIILGMAALFGAFSAIRDYFSVIFEAPDAVLSYTDNGRLNLVADTQFSVPISAQSEVRFTPMKIRYLSASLRPKSKDAAIDLQMQSSVVSSLSPGQTHVNRIDGTAPKHSPDQGAPDVYDLVVTADASAGMLGGHKPLTSHREVWVYSVDPIRSHPDKIDILGGRSCQLGGTFFSPRDYRQGLVLEIVLVTQPSEINQMIVNAPGVPVEKLLPAVNASTLQTFKFATPALNKFQAYSYQVYIEAPKVDQQNCEDWAKRLDITFQAQ
jgi:hypothetical protein